MLARGMLALVATYILLIVEEKLGILVGTFFLNFVDLDIVWFNVIGVER